ncbi:hypothetical protein [Brevundimonas bullata]|uniref:hypothetical protein n=1 Tax=Brevundimonas bullata TaxID=13160 RepID=UPI003D9A974E
MRTHQHGAIILGDVIGSGALAMRPFGLPEAKQNVDVAGKGFVVGRGDVVFLARLDLAQPAANLLPVIDAQFRQIGVPIRRQGDKRANADVRIRDLVEILDILVDETKRVKSRQEEPAAPVGHPQVAHDQLGPAELFSQKISEG